MSEMVERVARAIRDNIQAALPEGAMLDYDYAARAAIEAMQEPTRKMLSRSEWHAMIDAALTPGQPGG